MRRILGLENAGSPLPGSVVTLGKFFTVHIGHQALLRATVDEARLRGLPAVAVTFDRHPGEILRPGECAPCLARLDERLALMEVSGIDIALVLTVDTALLATEPEEFVRTVLVGQLGARLVLAGKDFRFGHRARGDLRLLEVLGADAGFECRSFPPVMLEGEAVSSSRIARWLRDGAVDIAARALGRGYRVSGQVVAGEQLGRRLGFPTANVQVDARRLLPADGVYAVRLDGAGLSAAPGVANLGVRPTIDGIGRRLEVHLLERECDLYGSDVVVTFVSRIRGEIRFPDLDALRAQIALDAATAAELLSRPGDTC